MKMSQIKVTFLSNEVMFRESIAKALSSIPFFDAHVGSIDKSTYNKLTALQNHTIVIDFWFGDPEVTHLVDRILKTFPKPLLVVLSSTSEPLFIRRMLKAGVLGYICRNSPLSELVHCIVQVSEGRNYLPELTTKGIQEADEKRRNLTLAELEVLQLVGKGLGNKQIADIKKVSIKAIEGHKTRIYRKLNIKSLAQLILYGKKLGVIVDI